MKKGCKSCIGYRNVLVRNIKDNGNMATYEKVMTAYLRHMEIHARLI